MNKPRIGLTMRLELSTGRFYLGRDYSEALQGLGATPVHLSLIPDSSYVADCLENLDGVLLPGSDTDVEPWRYNEEPHRKLGRVIIEKDETDAMVLAEAERKGLPVLAICYGMQALNVFRGGTLVQDIESQIKDSLQHQQGAPLERNSHSIEIEDHSILSGLVSQENKILVNSHHHQSVKRLGKNLKITARAKDGVIECIEDTRSNVFALGVQWHPELSWRTDELSRNIFEKFVEECKQK